MINQPFKDIISLMNFIEELPIEVINACTTSGSNDAAVEYYCIYYQFTVSPILALDHCVANGIDIEGLNHRELEHYVFWLECWSRKEGYYDAESNFVLGGE